MAGAMHKMAVYLGLVEEDRRYDDGYDSYEEYTEYEEQPEELPGEPAGQANLLAGDMGTAAARVQPGRRCKPPTSLVSQPCTRAHTMRLVRSGSTSARAPQ